MAQVILADDDPEVRRVYRIVLERAGHEVREAENGRQVIALHRQDPADVLIVDILMPEMDGLEVITTLRRMSSDVRIIAISGGERIEGGHYLDLAKKLGAHRVLAKPVSPSDLLEAVLEVLSES